MVRQYANDRLMPDSGLWTPVETSGANPADLALALKTQHLFHFNGANGSNTFYDACENGWTGYGNAQISTAQKMFGESSLLLDGNSDYVMLSVAPLNWYAEKFTWEAFVRLNALPLGNAWPGSWNSCMVVCGIGTSSKSDGFGLILTNTKIMAQRNDTVYADGTHGMSINTWYHVAVTRDGDTLRTFVDGVKKGESAFTGNTGSGDKFCIGCEATDGAWFNGYIDELRIIRGAALYTADFTPPSAAFFT